MTQSSTKTEQEHTPDSGYILGQQMNSGADCTNRQQQKRSQKDAGFVDGEFSHIHFDAPPIHIYPEDFTTKFNEAAFVMKVQIELKKFSYTSLSESGVWDKATQSTIEALQYHFRPENFDGKLDMETWAILQALNQKYSTK